MYLIQLMRKTFQIQSIQVSRVSKSITEHTLFHPHSLTFAVTLKQIK